MSMQAKLNAAKLAFKNARNNVAESKSGDWFTPEPGRKKVQITDGEVNESQAGRLQCYFGLTILEGEEAGNTFRKYYGIDEKGLEFLLKDLQRLEMDMPDDITLLEGTIAQIVKARPMLNVRVKEKGEFLNTYFDKMIKGEETGEVVEQQEPVQQELPTPTNEVAAEESDDISVGKTLMVEGQGLGTVSAIDEAKGMVTLKLLTGKSATVGVDKLSLPPVIAPKPTPMRVGKK